MTQWLGCMDHDRIISELWMHKCSLENKITKFEENSATASNFN